MFAALVAVRTRPAVVDSSIPLSTRTIAGMAALAVPFNLLLLVLLASQSPQVFAAWFGCLAVGGGYYLVWTRTTDRTTTTPTLDP